MVRLDEQEWGYSLVLDHPPVNALSDDLLHALDDALTELSRRRPPVMVLAAEGRHFCAGADLKAAHDTADQLQARLSLSRRVNELLRQVPFPTIAAIHGACLGAGMNLIASCDFRLAHESATFGIPEILRGRAGGAALLRGIIPEGTVRWLALTGRSIDAVEAHRVGLVVSIIPDAKWPAQVDAVAAQVAAHGLPGLYATKESLQRTRDLPVRDVYWTEQQLTYRLWTEGRRQRWDEIAQP